MVVGGTWQGKLIFSKSRIFEFKSSKCHVSVDFQPLEKIFLANSSQNLALSKAIFFFFHEKNQSTGWKVKNSKLSNKDDPNKEPLVLEL